MRGGASPGRFGRLTPNAAHAERGGSRPIAAHALATHASLAAHASAHAILDCSLGAEAVPLPLAIGDSRRCLSLEERDARRCLSRAVRSAHAKQNGRIMPPRGSRGGAHAIADHAWERVGVHRESVATPCHQQANASPPTLRTARPEGPQLCHRTRPASKGSSGSRPPRVRRFLSPQYMSLDLPEGARTGERQNCLLSPLRAT